MCVNQPGTKSIQSKYPMFARQGSLLDTGGGEGVGTETCPVWCTCGAVLRIRNQHLPRVSLPTKEGPDPWGMAGTRCRTSPRSPVGRPRLTGFKGFL